MKFPSAIFFKSSTEKEVNEEINSWIPKKKATKHTHKNVAVIYDFPLIYVSI